MVALVNNPNQKGCKAAKKPKQSEHPHGKPRYRVFEDSKKRKGFFFALTLQSQSQ